MAKKKIVLGEGETSVIRHIVSNETVEVDGETAFRYTYDNGDVEDLII